MSDAAPRLTLQLVIPDALAPEYLEGNRVLPLAVERARLQLASCGAPADHVLHDLELLFGIPVDVVAVDEGTLFEALRRVRASSESVVAMVRDLDAELAGTDEAEGTAATDLRGLANQPPVVRFVNLLIREAAAGRASDIHLDAARDGLRVRYRVDGVLAEVPSPPRGLAPAIVSRLKLLGHLDIAERRLPQDGRLRVRLEARDLDLRVATVPSHFGESVTLRLLDHGGRPSGLEALGLPADVHAALREAALRPHGIVLATGPTGSGKTTTLHAALALRDRMAERIVTIEDPVEYEVPGVLQVAVNERTGLTFARALRTFVRLDPDVLMVGEMRDEETADIAVRAAMTGHLVFSSLHTNDAVAAIPRLLDLQVPAYLVAATIEAVLAQRLVRRTCPECRVRYNPDAALVAQVAGRPVGRMRLERGAGCAACRDTGFHGRLGVFEFVRMTPELRQAIGRGADLSALRELAVAGGMRPLRHDAWAKVEAGLTTVEEVLRVVQ